MYTGNCFRNWVNKGLAFREKEWWVIPSLHSAGSVAITLSCVTIRITKSCELTESDVCQVQSCTENEKKEHVDIRSSNDRWSPSSIRVMLCSRSIVGENRAVQQWLE